MPFSLAVRPAPVSRQSVGVTGAPSAQPVDFAHRQARHSRFTGPARSGLAVGPPRVAAVFAATNLSAGILHPGHPGAIAPGRRQEFWSTAGGQRSAVLAGPTTPTVYRSTAPSEQALAEASLPRGAKSPWRRAGMAWLCVGRLPRFLCKRERGPAAALHPAPTARLLRWHVTVRTSLRSGGQRCRHGPSGLPTRGMYVKRASPDGLTGGRIFAPRALARAASHLSIRRTALLVNDLGQARAEAFRQLSLTQA